MIENIFKKKKYTPNEFKKLLNSNPNIEQLQEALNSGIDINFVDNSGETFLHYCLKKGFTKAGVFTINNGIDVNIKDNDHTSPIDLAIEKNNRIIAKLLIETNKIKVNELKGNRTLLQDAVLHGDKEIVDMLLKTTINKHHIDHKNRNIIFDAVGNGNEKIIDSILEVEDLELNLLDDDGRNVLHQKNVIEDDKLAIKLIRKGADPTIVGKDGKSYLLHAALRGIETEEIIDVAIAAGFNISRPVRNKNSILMELMFSFTKLSESEMERREDLMAMAQKLVKKGIDVNATNEQGETALFDAVRRLDIQACMFLLKEKVPINVVNKNGDTALGELVYKGIISRDIVLLLLKYDANLYIKNRYNQTIVEVLSDLVLFTHGKKTLKEDIKQKVNMDGDYTILLKEILLNSSFDTSTISSRGEPIFFDSLLSDHKPLFDLFCLYGVDINASDVNGNNLFLRYIDKVSLLPTVPNDFRDGLIVLINKKIDINKQDDDGKTILSKLVAKDNMRLFRILFSVAKFNYSQQDIHGFTIIHECIKTGNIDVIKLINQLDDKLINTPDNAGILPITYAALFGKTDIVLELIKLQSNFKSNKSIASSAKVKLSLLLENLDKLATENKDDQRKLDILIEQIRRDLSE